MAQSVSVKICGLSHSEQVLASAEAGASYIGFVFFEKSPRNLTFEAANKLASYAPVGLAKVALVVNADDRFLDTLIESVPLDVLQLHGSETPERTAQIKQRYRLPVMKAVGVATAADLVALEAYMRVSDQVLVDAKPSEEENLPGGNGLAFDWDLIVGRRWPVPWMLAGGLTPANVASAVRLTGARQVDVSSGVESLAGVKDPDMIHAFIRAAQSKV